VGVRYHVSLEDPGKFQLALNATEITLLVGIGVGLEEHCPPARLEGELVR